MIRRIEVIGEAVKNIPDKIKRRYPNIPWREIAGMRDDEEEKALASHIWL